MGGGLVSVRRELLVRGEFGELAVGLLYQLMQQELSKVPHLTGSERWAGADPMDAAHAFFVAKGTTVTRRLIAEAPDDVTVGRLLRTAIKRWLVDQARKTATGARHRRLEKVLTDEDELFEQVPDGQPGAGRWRLRGAGGPSEVPLRDLIAAAWTVTDVHVPTWTSDNRRPPFADHPSLVRVLTAVLASAYGSITVATLVLVCSDRFPIGLEPAVRPLEGESSTGADSVDFAARALDGAINERIDDTAGEVVARETATDLHERAQRVFDELTRAERRLLPVLSESVERRRAVLGLGRSQTQLQTKALRTRLRAMIGVEPGEGRDPERDEILLRLVDLCSRPNEAVTPDGMSGVPSDPGTRQPDQGGDGPGER